MGFDMRLDTLLANASRSCRARTAAKASCGVIGFRLDIIDVVELGDCGAGTGNGRLRVVEVTEVASVLEERLTVEFVDAVEVIEFVLEEGWKDGKEVCGALYGEGSGDVDGSAGDVDIAVDVGGGA